MVTAAILATALQAPGQEVWAKGGYFADTIPFVVAEVDGKPANLAVNPSQPTSLLVADLGGGGEATVKVGETETTVRAKIYVLPAAFSAGWTSQKAQGVLGRDVLDRLALGFAPSGPRWRVWKGEAPEAEAKAFVGSPAESLRVYIDRNVAWVPFFTAVGREDAVLNLEGNVTNVPPKGTEKAGWPLRSNPIQLRYTFSAGYGKGEGAGLVVYEGSNAVLNQAVSLGATNLSDLPFVLDVPGRRLWRQKPAGDRLIEHRLWTMTSLFLSVTGDRLGFRPGGPIPGSHFQPYAETEVLSIAGMDAAEIVKALREEDQAKLQSWGEALSKTYAVVVRRPSGKTITLNITVD